MRGFESRRMIRGMGVKKEKIEDVCELLDVRWLEWRFCYREAADRRKGCGEKI